MTCDRGSKQSSPDIRESTEDDLSRKLGEVSPASFGPGGGQAHLCRLALTKRTLRLHVAVAMASASDEGGAGPATKDTEVVAFDSTPDHDKLEGEKLPLCPLLVPPLSPILRSRGSFSLSHSRTKSESNAPGHPSSSSPLSLTHTSPSPELPSHRLSRGNARREETARRKREMPDSDTSISKCP